MDNRENQSEACQEMGKSLRILVLQHPRESRREAGTANLLQDCYPAARIRKGLAWSNLKKAWNGSAKPVDLDPKKWAVLFLSGRGEAAAAGEEPGFYENSKGKAKPFQSQSLEGVILLDGNWKEAKTLWWRNAWLIRLKKLVLVEEKTGGLRQRRSAHKTALTTAECAAYCLKYLGNDAAGAEKLLKAYSEMAF